MASQSLDSWLAPSSVFKRKLDETADISDKENTPTSATASRKKAKPNPTSKTKPTPKPKAKTSSTNASTKKEAKKLYTDTLKAVDKRVADLDKRVKVMSGNSRAITTASYATSAGKHVKTALKLAAMDPVLGSNLLLSLADASHTDLDASCKMCGTPCDSSVPTFAAIDEALLPLIEARHREAGAGEMRAAVAAVPKRWTRADAEVGEFKTSNGPNKQQRGQMYRQKLEWEKRRTAARRARRDAAEEGWVAVALADLKEERDYLDAYGVEKYLPKCIARLEELVSVDEAPSA